MMSVGGKGEAFQGRIRRSDISGKKDTGFTPRRMKEILYGENLVC